MSWPAANHPGVWVGACLTNVAETEGSIDALRVLRAERLQVLTVAKLGCSMACRTNARARPLPRCASSTHTSQR